MKSLYMSKASFYQITGVYRPVRFVKTRKTIRFQADKATGDFHLATDPHIRGHRVKGAIKLYLGGILTRRGIVEHEFVDVRKLREMSARKQLNILHKYFSENPLNFKNVAALNRSANACMELGLLEDAQAWFNRILDLAPQDLAALYGLGKISLMKGERHQAKRYFDRILEIDKEDPHAINGLVLLAMEQENYDEAEVHLRRLLQLEPQNIYALSRLGNIALYWEDYDEAEAIFKKLSEVEQNSLYALAGFGMIALSRGEHEKAKNISTGYWKSSRIILMDCMKEGAWPY